jgi:hypothetical protein
MEKITKVPLGLSLQGQPEDRLSWGRLHCHHQVSHCWNLRTIPGTRGKAFKQALEHHAARQPVQKLKRALGFHEPAKVVQLPSIVESSKQRQCWYLLLRGAAGDNREPGFPKC